jgi:hypothetical protein
MRAASWIAAAWLTASALAPAARADVLLDLGLEAALEYDDNVLFQANNILSDGAVRLGPRVRLHEDGDQLLWDVHYYPTYEKFFDLGEFDGWDHDGYASATWKASPRTTLRFTDQYQDYNRAVSVLAQQDVTTPAGEAGANLGLRGFQQNYAYAELNHRLARRDTVQLYLQNIYTEGDPLSSFTGNEGLVTTGSLSYLREWDPRNQIGLSIRATDQRFDDFVQPETRTQFYNLSFQFVHLFDPTFTLSASAGPAYVSSDIPEAEGLGMDQALFPFIRDGTAQGPVLIDTCPTLDDGTPFVGNGCRALPIQDVPVLIRPALTQTTDLPVVNDGVSDSGSTLTYFAALSLTKQWSTVTATARYIRDASQSVSASGNVRDVVLGSLNWRPTGRWRLMFVASYERREQALESIAYASALSPTLISVTGGGTETIGRAIELRAVPVEQDASTDRIVLSLNVNYQWNRQLAFFANAYWIDQKQRGDIFANEGATRFNIVVGLRYYLEPIRLPI